MKAHTDLEQSKKLEEILPIESADMFFSGCAYPKELHLPTFSKTSIKDNIPCWSLAALLNVINDDYYTKLYHDGMAWNITVIHHDNVKDKHNVYANTPVDACVAMILKLHELKLL